MIQIIFAAVVGEWLHNHPRAMLRECLFDVFRSADRIAHVMQTIEVGNEVVLLAGIVCGLRHCKGHVLQACFFGPFACGQDRGLMVIETDEDGCGIGLRHDNGRRPEPAADIRDFRALLERCFHTVEGRNPIRHEVAQVVRAEESLSAFKQSVIVLIPPEALAGLEPLLDLGVG